MQSHETFYVECEAVGLPEPLSISGSVPRFGTELTPYEQQVCDALVAANGQEISSDECLALRSLLGGASPEWDAYVDVKLEATRQSRRYWYFHESDDMFMDAMATMDTAKASVALGVSTERLDAWIEKRQQIADAIPPGTDISVVDEKTLKQKIKAIKKVTV